VTEGADAGREIVIEEGTMMIGRGTEATLSFLDKLMSRVHCKIVRQGRQVMFNDLGSTNGSFINEVKVESRELKPGDVLRLGGTVFVFNVK
jgi:pSer/pThr/pTyr-binding forkhead associated (FHA) protein